MCPILQEERFREETNLHDRYLAHLHGFERVCMTLRCDARAALFYDTDFDFRHVRLDQQCIGDDADVRAETDQRDTLDRKSVV